MRALRNRIKLGVRLAGNLFEGCGELKIGRSALMSVSLGAAITAIIPS
jgi:hypothetical protein